MKDTQGFSSNNEVHWSYPFGYVLTNSIRDSSEFVGDYPCF